MDANLNHCLATGRSVTGCLHFVNHTPIDSYSRRQATVETTTYGSEFVASKTATEQIIDAYQNKIILVWGQQVSGNQFHSSTLNIGQKT